MEFTVEVGEDNVPFLQLGKYVLKLDEEAFDGKYIEVARDEFRETPENVENGLEQLRKLIKGRILLHTN